MRGSLLEVAVERNGAVAASVLGAELSFWNVVTQKPSVLPLQPARVDGCVATPLAFCRSSVAFRSTMKGRVPDRAARECHDFNHIYHLFVVKRAMALLTAINSTISPHSKIGINTASRRARCGPPGWPRNAFPVALVDMSPLWTLRGCSADSINASVKHDSVAALPAAPVLELAAARQRSPARSARRRFAAVAHETWRAHLSRRRAPVHLIVYA